MKEKLKGNQEHLTEGDKGLNQAHKFHNQLKNQNSVIKPLCHGVEIKRRSISADKRA